MARRGEGTLMIMVVGEIRKENNVLFWMLRGDKCECRGLKFYWGHLVRKWGEGETEFW